VDDWVDEPVDVPVLVSVFDCEVVPVEVSLDVPVIETVEDTELVAVDVCELTSHARNVPRWAASNASFIVVVKLSHSPSVNEFLSPSLM
jgi:hypothetical protein